MLIRKYEMPWRTAFECYAAAAWIGAATYLVLLAWQSEWPDLQWAFAAVALAMASLRVAQGLKLLILRASLCGRAVEVITTRRLKEVYDRAHPRAR